MNINKSASGYFAIRLFLLALPLFYFIDGLYKILYVVGIDFRIGPIIKGFFVIFILFYSLLNLNKSKLHIYLTLFLLSCCFFVGQFFLDFKVDNLNFIENFNRFFKYLSPFIFLLLALDILTLKEYPKKIEIYLKWVLGINNILILIV